MTKKGSDTTTETHKADWLTVLTVTPIVEHREGQPLPEGLNDDDLRRFSSWLNSYRKATDVLALVLDMDVPRTVAGRLAEDYALFIEDELPNYAMDLMLRFDPAAKDEEDEDDGYGKAEFPPYVAPEDVHPEPEPSKPAGPLLSTKGPKEKEKKASIRTLNLWGDGQ